jgi:hypothetical protein
VSFTVRYESADGEKPSGENRQSNVLLPPGGSHTTSPLVPARHGDRLADNIHPWVRGFVWVFDHPYFAVTDDRGDFTIPDAPVGTWRLVVWHEKAGYLTRARGRRGERIIIAPDRELKLIALESANWGE